MFEETIVSNRSYAGGSSVEMKLSTSDRDSIEKHHLIGTFEPLHNSIIEPIQVKKVLHYSYAIPL